MTQPKRHPALVGPRPPKYLLSDLLRAQIASGELAPGQQLPSVAQLARDYGVAPNTAKGALDLLKAEGLAEAWQGYGTFVAAA